MTRWTIGLLAALALMSGAAGAADDPASVEKRLADAQRRLEDAAREVAELSGEAAGPAYYRAFEGMRLGRKRAMLGVNLDDGAPEGSGVRVASVSPGGPAAEAGVQSGDVIVAIQSKPVTTSREVVRTMESVKPGDKVKLSVRRSGKPVDLEVEAQPLDMMFIAGTPGVPALPALPAIAAAAPMAAFAFDGEGHWLLDEWGDAELVTMTPGLGRYFGTDKGVLVARAPGDKSLGLEDGDVIVAIDGREPQNGRHAMRILRSYQPGESVDLKVLRDRKERTLSMKVPARAGRDFPHRAAPPKPPTPPEPPAPAAS